MKGAILRGSAFFIYQLLGFVYNLIISTVVLKEVVMRIAPVVDLVSFRLRKREGEFRIRNDSRVNTSWGKALSYWYYIFDQAVDFIANGKPLTKEELRSDIAWAKEESMKMFGISRDFKDPESLWFFAVCEDTLEPLAWRLARLKKHNRKVINIRRRTAQIIQMPVR